MSQIGTLSEKSLHAALKEWIGRPGDQFEVKLDGYIIDILRGKLLIEIQTRHLYLMKRKLNKLLPNHAVRLIHPIPKEKWIVRQTANGKQISRRKSPKQGKVIDIFNELVRIPNLLSHPNLTIELLMTQQDEILRDDGKGSWRRKHWSVYDHQLIDVIDNITFNSKNDYTRLLPANLPQPFTNKELAEALPCSPHLARKITYTLRQMGEIDIVGKRRNAFLYENTNLMFKKKEKR